jgi:excisionase family DNA binding protein
LHTTTVSELTVPEVARRTGKNAETIRRWIRAGKLPSRRVGTQHIVESGDVDRLIDAYAGMLPLPPHLRFTRSGAPMPNVVAVIREHRARH